MAHSTIISDYFAYGTFASRPVTPPVASGIVSFYFATDTSVMYVWTGASWVAVTAAVSGGALGATINSGTVEINNTVTLAGTAAGTTTIAPGSGTSDVIVNMPSAGGTVTLAAAPSFLNQKAVVQIKQGATAGVIVLNSGFVFAPSGGPTSFTVTATASVRDELGVHSPDGTHWVVDGLLQGLTI